ncbi:MAG: ion transporter [Alphaproteobacteria bacterium]|jgi:voltage-gated sodium channel
MRAKLLWLVEHPRFQRTIIALILVNAVTLGLETSPWVMDRIGSFLLVLDRTILAVFVVEIVLRLGAHGWRFFRDPWSLFDFVIVGIALVPASDAFSVLRALRILRVLRLISAVPRMRQVVQGLLGAIPGIAAIMALLLLVFYVCAVIATKLFAAAFPEWFGHIGASMFSLFQIMTLESWSMGIVRPVMEQFPLAWLFFVPFILVATFTILNLFIAVVVGAMQAEHDAEVKADQDETRAAMRAAEEVAHTEREAMRNEVSALRGEIAALRQELAGLNDGPKS